MNNKKLFLILGLVVLLASLTLVAFPALGLQPIGMAIALAVIAGFSALSILSSHRQHRSLLREVTKVDDRLSRVEYRTQPVHDIRGSVVKTSAEVRETLRRIRELADERASAGSMGVDARSEGNPEAIQRSVFAPNSIRASAIQDRPKMHIPGRDAARQDMKMPGEQNLARLLLAPEADLKRDIAFVGGEGLLPTLKSVGTVTVITPGMGETAVSNSTAYLVVDIATIAETAWRGVLDASRTRLYQELHAVVKSAREHGTVVILHGHDVPSHFTASLEKLAHVRLQNNRMEPARWGSDVSTEVLEAIADFDSQAPRVEVTTER